MLICNANLLRLSMELSLDLSSIINLGFSRSRIHVLNDYHTPKGSLLASFPNFGLKIVARAM